MRKILVSNSITLDGVFEGPVHLPFEKFKHAGWTEPYASQEQMEYLSKGISGDGTLLLGRVTYQYFEAAWTPQTGPVADFMNNAAKYVVSTTLKKADWHNSTLLIGDGVEAVRKLKQQPGGDIAILGSGTLMRSLMDHDLIDEYSLLVYPLVLGAGKRLLGDQHKTALKLKESRAFSSGVVLSTYEPDRK